MKKVIGVMLALAAIGAVGYCIYTAIDDKRLERNLCVPDNMDYDDDFVDEDIDKEEW